MYAASQWPPLRECFSVSSMTLCLSRRFGQDFFYKLAKFHEPGEVGGFLQEPVCPKPKGFRPVLRGIGRGEHDDRSSGEPRQVSKPFEDANTAVPRQIQVQYKKIRARRRHILIDTFQNFQRFFPVPRQKQLILSDVLVESTAH